MGELIRRAVYPKKGSPETIRIVEGDIGPLAANHVRIDVHYAGINFADLMMRMGFYGAAPPFPFTPGYEVSGTIIEIGKDVRNRSVGDRVVAMTRYGGYSTMVDIHPNQSFILGPKQSLESAAAIPVTYATAHHMLVHLGRIREGDTVLVHHAAGGVGTAVAQIAKAKGAALIIGTSSAHKKEFVESMGMHHIPRGDDFVVRCRELTNGKGVDHALDPVGGKHLLKSYKALAKGGKLYTFGGSSAVPGKRPNIFAALWMWWRLPRFDPLRMMNSNKAVFGIHLGTWEKEEIMRDQMKEIVEMQKQGLIDPVVDSVFPLIEVAKAQTHMHERKNRGKILLDCRD